MTTFTVISKKILLFRNEKKTKTSMKIKIKLVNISSQSDSPLRAYAIEKIKIEERPDEYRKEKKNQISLGI